jgi:hypothetical protein
MAEAELTEATLARDTEAMLALEAAAALRALALVGGTQVGGLSWHLALGGT